MSVIESHSPSGRVENVQPDLKGSLQTYNNDEHLHVEILRGKMAQMGAKEHTHRQQIRHSRAPPTEKVIRQDRYGKYEIHQVFYDEYRRLTTT